MIRHGATALARQSGRCHHPHIPVRSRGRAVAARSRAVLCISKVVLYNGSGTLRALAQSGLAASIKFARLGESVSRGWWCSARTRRRTTRHPRGRRHARECVRPRLERCAERTSDLGCFNARGPPITAHTVSSEAPISTCSWPNLCTRYALRATCTHAPRNPHSTFTLGRQMKMIPPPP